MDDLVAQLNRELSVLRDAINELKAENLLIKVLVPHVVGLIVRRAQDPQKYLEDIRSSSLTNLTANVKFEGGDSPGNQEMIRRAKEAHEQIFEELKRALGQRSGTTH